MNITKIAFAYTEHQGNVIVQGSIANKTREALNIESFPKYPKIDFMSDPSYEGLKIFAVDKDICISHFFNERKRDCANRPILSAKVAVIPADIFNNYGRDLNAIRDYLRQTSIDTMSDSLFTAFIKNNSMVSEFNRISRFVAQYDYNFLADSICCLSLHMDAKILYRDVSEGLSFIRAIYVFLPISSIMKTSFSSVCEYEHPLNRESFVLVPKKDYSTLSKIKGFFERKNQEERESYEVDIAQQQVRPKCHGKGVKEIISEIVSDFTWYSFTWDEKYALLLDYLNDTLSEKKESLLSMSEKLGTMKETLERVRELERQRG